MNEHLRNLVYLMRQVENDKYNPETYFSNNISGESGMLISKNVLGNLYAKGYSNIANVNFEIFKDHSTWQIWVWGFESVKSENNQLSVPYYKYDDVIEFFKNM